MKISIFKQVITDAWLGFMRTFFSSRRDRYAHISRDSFISQPCWGIKKNIYLYENCHILGCGKFIGHGKFIMKKNSIAAMGLTVITDEHPFYEIGIIPGDERFIQTFTNDVIIEEGVWLGANVTLLPGAVIGRGALIGAGAVIKSIIPPYAVVIGNPAKVIKFRFTPDEVIEHEKLNYNNHERLSKELLEENLLKYLKIN